MAYRKWYPIEWFCRIVLKTLQHSVEFFCRNLKNLFYRHSIEYFWQGWPASSSSYIFRISVWCSSCICWSWNVESKVVYTTPGGSRQKQTCTTGNSSWQLEMLPQILLSQRPHIVAVGSNFACYNFIRGAFLLFTEAGEILSVIYNV